MFGSEGAETAPSILLWTEISGISGIMESRPSNPLEIKFILYTFVNHKITELALCLIFICRCLERPKPPYQPSCYVVRKSPKQWDRYSVTDVCDENFGESFIAFAFLASYLYM